MKKNAYCLLFSILCIFLSVSSAQSVPVSVSGPKQYVREKGAPTVYNDTFVAIEDKAAIVITNGDAEGDNRISSGRVYINGVEIFGVNDFNRKVESLEAAVDLLKNNSISVELNSAPGSFLNIEIIQEIAPPTVTINADPQSIRAGEVTTLSWGSENTESCTIEPGIGSIACNGSLDVSPAETTTYLITAENLAGIAGAEVSVEVGGGTEPQPEGSFGSQYNDIIPPDATIESYDPKRFSLITGLVHDINDLPLTGVSINIHGHPEYGTVATDADGRFTVPVEGGGNLKVVYRKPGLIEVHRQVSVPWNDIAIAKTVQMISEDPVATTMVFDGDPDKVVTHTSSTVTDEFGSRSATIVFTGDNRAYALDENGDPTHELTTITARATEFPTPESMPAVLPPNSAFTYCVELSVDGVGDVRFEKPVVTWVDNFLGFEVGEAVPVGYYERDRVATECADDTMAGWVPADNGVVVRLLDTDNNGIVDALDADGDDLPDDLDGDGDYTDEVNGLENPGIYVPGSTYWRVEVSHFTPWDHNWPYAPPADAVPPNPVTPPDADQQAGDEQAPPEKEKCISSYVNNRSRVFHEDIPVPGTDISLHYASNRVSDYKTAITIPASGDSVPTSLKRIIVKVELAGRDYEQILPPLPNQQAVIDWDGLDSLGRPVKGSVTAQISVGFEYNLVYQSAGDFYQAFAKAGQDVTGIRGREDVISWKRNSINIIGKSESIASGWTISEHHTLNHDGLSLFKGDGSSTSRTIPTINTVAGRGWAYDGDGMPATETLIGYIEDIAIDKAGNLYMSDTYYNQILKVDTDGILTTIAGTGTAGFSGDGGPATEAQFDFGWWGGGLAVDDSGNIYVADSYNNRIRKINTCGIVTTIAGDGTIGTIESSGDGGPATEAQIGWPTRVAVDKNGNIYVSELYINSIWGGGRVRIIDSNGIINTYAGNGTWGFSGDGGPAVDAQMKLLDYGDIEVDSQGNLYICDEGNYRIRKVDTNGIITTVAGGGTQWNIDGIPATDAGVWDPIAIAIDTADNLYILYNRYSLVQKVNTGGIIFRVAGDGTYAVRTFYGDGGPALEAKFYHPNAIDLDANQDLYIADSMNYRIRKTSNSTVTNHWSSPENIVFADANGLGHLISNAGMHQATINLDTGVALREFGYNAEDQIISITDQFGNQTIIERDIDGTPTAIISSDGLRTALTIDADNHLAAITYPDGAYYSFEYSAGGLMTAEVEPNGNRFKHVFDSFGRLTDVLDQEGGHWSYNRTMLDNGDILVNLLTGEGNQTTYLDHYYSTGEFTSTTTGPTGAQILFSQSYDGLPSSTSLPCGMDIVSQYGLDPKYSFKFVKETVESTPAGLVRITSNDRNYQDTDGDDIPDLITQSITVNNQTSTIENNTLLAHTTVTSPEGRVVTSDYDPASLLTSSISTAGLLDTNFTYDAKGRPTSSSIGIRSTFFGYNNEGFLDYIIDPEGFTTSYTYDQVGRVTSVGRPDLTSLGFAYDANSNMTVLTNPAAIDHGFGYNGVNNQALYQTPLSGPYSYIYDKDRRLIQKIFPSGRQINNIYDTTQLTQIQTPEGNIDISYLCSSKVETISNGAEAISYGYDGSFVTSETQTGILNQTFNYAYNNDFNLANFTYAGATAGFTYDNDGLLVGANGFTIARNMDNGLAESVSRGGFNLARGFNGYGEIEGEDFFVNGQNSSSWTAGRDDAGRITGKTETMDGVTSDYAYTYDPMGRLLTVTKDGILVEEYQYDATGTRISEMNSLRGIAGRSMAYDDEDKLLTAGDASYVYDADGFLATKIEGAQITSYDYASRGELLSVGLPDGGLIEYVNDPLGRRIAKKVGGVITEKYLWSGLTQLLAVYDNSDNLLMRFEYADGRMPVSMTSNGATYYLAYDQVGSLRIVADSTGNVVRKIDYDSFGNIVSDSNPFFDMPFGFAGGLHDRDTGLIRFGYRDYDPDTGRWTAKDPIFFAGGDTDLFGYVQNNPVNFIDPLGEFGVAGAIVGAVTGAYGGFLSGIQSGNIAAGVIGGVAGATVGGVVGAIMPQFSGALGGMIGGGVAGMFGGGAGAALATALDPCSSGNDISNAASKGMLYGGLTGVLGGAYGAGAASLGASGAAVDVSGAMFTNSIGMGLGLIK